MKYAEIDMIDNTVRAIGEAPILPVFDNVCNIKAVDITKLDPQPGQGWVYDGKSFKEPPIQEPPIQDSK